LTVKQELLLVGDRRWRKPHRLDELDSPANPNGQSKLRNSGLGGLKNTKRRCRLDGRL